MPQLTSTAFERFQYKLFTLSSRYFRMNTVTRMQWISTNDHTSVGLILMEIRSRESHSLNMQLNLIYTIK